MAPDFERRSNRRPQSPHALFNDRDKDRTLTGPATSLTHTEISQALLDSPDEGGTLDFSHKNIGNVGDRGAEELAAVGTDDHNECVVLRYVAVLCARLGNPNRMVTESRLVITV